MFDTAASWLVQGAPGATQPQDILNGLCRRLVDDGVGIDRVVVIVRTLHPDIVARRFLWERAKEVEVSEAPYTLLTTESFRHSPVAQVLETGEPLHVALAELSAQETVGIFEELQRDGFTDYLIQPLRFTSGDNHTVSWTTRRPGGFTDQELAGFDSICDPLARMAEIFALRRVASTLLNTYVGHDTGERILGGAIRRGDVTTIRAAILLADVRDFSLLSNREAPARVIDTLNQFYDCAIPPIERAGGEVLKFIGDAFLAIFPCTKDEEPATCSKALDSALEIRHRVAEFNESNATDYHLRFGIALHVGDVEYGNIGSKTRLDFTAIGPAVNLVARLQTVAAQAGRDIVLSERVSQHLNAELDLLGSFQLKGFEQSETIFALP